MTKAFVIAGLLVSAVSVNAFAREQPTTYSFAIGPGLLLPTNGSNGPVQTQNSLPSTAQIHGGWVSLEAYNHARGFDLPIVAD